MINLKKSFINFIKTEFKENHFLIKEFKNWLECDKITHKNIFTAKNAINYTVSEFKKMCYTKGWVTDPTDQIVKLITQNISFRKHILMVMKKVINEI